MLHQPPLQLVHQRLAPKEELAVLRAKGEQPAEGAAAVILGRRLSQGQGMERQIQGLTAELVGGCQSSLPLAPGLRAEGSGVRFQAGPQGDRQILEIAL